MASHTNKNRRYNGDKRDPKQGNPKNGNKRRSNSYRNKGRDELTDEKSPDGKLSSLNDISWYNRNPDLLQAAGMISFPYKPGMSVPTGTFTDPTSRAVENLSYQIPGALQIAWVPSVGFSDSATSPASIVSRELYARVRASFSGSLAVDAPDLLIYLLALDSVFSYIGSLKRIYRIANAYSPYNYTLPDTLLSACGLSTACIQDVKLRRVQMWQNINELIGMTSKFRCPAVFDYFNRHYWMNDNVYADAMTPSSQMFVFYESMVWKFAMLNTPDNVPAGGLQATTVSYNSVDDMFQFGKELIDALSESEDAYTISGYLERAFDGTPNFFVEPLGQDEVFSPSYVPEVLSQIENVQTISRFADLEGAGHINSFAFNVTQDPKTNRILFRPSVTFALMSSTNGEYRTVENIAMNNFLNLRPDVPSVAEITIASRLTACLEERAIGGGEAVYNVHGGTELVHYLKLFTNKAMGGVLIPTVMGFASDGMNAMLYNDYLNMFQLFTFDWHPQIWVVHAGTKNGTGSFMPAFDVHNLTQVSTETLKNLHTICLYSEFNSFGQI